MRESQYNPCHLRFVCGVMVFSCSDGSSSCENQEFGDAMHPRFFLRFLTSQRVCKVWSKRINIKPNQPKKTSQLTTERKNKFTTKTYNKILKKLHPSPLLFSLLFGSQSKSKNDEWWACFVLSFTFNNNVIIFSKKKRITIMIIWEIKWKERWRWKFRVSPSATAREEVVSNQRGSHDSCLVSRLAKHSVISQLPLPNR